MKYFKLEVDEVAANTSGVYLFIDYVSLFDGGDNPIMLNANKTKAYFAGKEVANTPSHSLFGSAGCGVPQHTMWLLGYRWTSRLKNFRQTKS